MDSKPLYAIKAELFKSLAHPARIQVLEVLAGPDTPAPVSLLLETTGAEPSALSQHLAVLKRAGVVTSARTGNTVHYRLAEPLVAELLVVARAFLLKRLAGNGSDAASFDAARSLPAVPGASPRALLATPETTSSDLTAASETVARR